MKEPALAQRLVSAVRSAVPPHLPVTVKHRAGWDERHLNAPEFACAMVEAGAAMVTVHGRTRTQGFSGRADRAVIRRVRELVPAHVPVVGNGDVLTVEDDLRMREETGCDAVMIGRGAMGNPWLFRSIAARLAGRPDPGPPNLEERRAVFRRHLDLMTAHTPQKKLVHELRKAVAWYTRGLRDSAHVRARAFQVLDPAQVLEIGEAYFSSLSRQQKVHGGVLSTVDKTTAQTA
jgi:nifR3 family TIM-barrel protein